MYDVNPELKNSLHEVSACVGRTGRILVSSDRSPAAETYMAAIRAIRELRDAWRLHTHVESAMLPELRSRDPDTSRHLERIADDNDSIGRQLTSFTDAPWPRSPQAGLRSIRSGVAEVLVRLRAQIERERTTILPALLRMDRRGVDADRTKSDVQELVGTGIP